MHPRIGRVNPNLWIIILGPECLQKISKLNDKLKKGGGVVVSGQLSPEENREPYPNPNHCNRLQDKDLKVCR